MKILLAVDGSESSRAAVEEVGRRPWPNPSEVRIVTAEPPIEASLLTDAADSGVFDELVKQQSEFAGARLEEAAGLLRTRAPHLLVTTARITGRPKDVIVDDAERWGADLIVLGSHGYGALRRFLLGSVSLAVALNAPCSVEIVR
jgi:nucleotide-binding universal stress UspA family protein